VDHQDSRLAVVRIRGPVAEALSALIDAGAVFGSLVRGTYPHPVTDVVLTVGVLSDGAAKKVKKLLQADAPGEIG
jgi:hypothetical protein